MYYVLFHYIKKTGKDWYCFLTESKVIEFLHENYEDIEVDQIIEVKAEYRLGLIVTEDYAKSALEPEEETEPLVDLGRKPEEILKEKKSKLKEIEAEEPSAMEKIADEIEEEIKEDELTPEQRTQKSLDDADDVIERAKKREDQKKKGWELCIKCNRNRVAPWNKKKICSTCQNKRSTTRPYKRTKEFLGPEER